MKSCLGILIISILAALILGGGGFLYYLSSTTEFERVSEKDTKMETGR